MADTLKRHRSSESSEQSEQQASSSVGARSVQVSAVCTWGQTSNAWPVAHQQHISDQTSRSLSSGGRGWAASASHDNQSPPQARQRQGCSERGLLWSLASPQKHKESTQSLSLCIQQHLPARSELSTETLVSGSKSHHATEGNWIPLIVSTTWQQTALMRRGGNISILLRDTQLSQGLQGTETCLSPVRRTTRRQFYSVSIYTALSAQYLHSKTERRLKLHAWRVASTFKYLQKHKGAAWEDNPLLWTVSLKT